MKTIKKCCIQYREIKDSSFLKMITSIILEEYLDSIQKKSIRIRNKKLLTFTKKKTQLRKTSSNSLRKKLTKISTTNLFSKAKQNKPKNTFHITSTIYYKATK